MKFKEILKRIYLGFSPGYLLRNWRMNWRVRRDMLKFNLSYKQRYAIVRFKSKIRRVPDKFRYWARLIGRLYWEKQTCPLRSGVGPWDQGPRLDYWDTTVKDRTCSFCGSWHPKDFIDFISADGEFWLDDRNALEVNDRRDKIYVRRPGIRNAGEGAIKIKLVHLRGDMELIDKILREAISESRERRQRMSVND